MDWLRKAKLKFRLRFVSNFEYLNLKTSKFGFPKGLGIPSHCWCNDRSYHHVFRGRDSLKTWKLFFMNLGRWLTFCCELAQGWAFKLEMGRNGEWISSLFQVDTHVVDNAQGWVVVYIEGEVKDKWRVWDLHYRVDHNEWCCEQRWATLQGESLQQMDLLKCAQNWSIGWCVSNDGLMCANRGRMYG